MTNALYYGNNIDVLRESIIVDLVYLERGYSRLTTGDRPTRNGQ
jgi:hypothetical protein